MDGQIVCVRAAPDESHYFVGSRINDVVDVSGVVALEDAYGDPVVGIEPGDPLARRRCRQKNNPEKGGQRSGSQ
jgi:hypothetical protein